MTRKRRGQRYATPGDVETLAGTWSTEVLVCRNNSHRFTRTIRAVHSTTYHFIYLELACEGNCGVVQQQEMDESGHVYWSALKYPKEGYLSNSGRIVGDAKDRLRLEVVRRVIRPTKTARLAIKPHERRKDKR